MPSIADPIRPLLAGAVIAGAVLSASPARAEVTFDFAAYTGYAGAAELRYAFGWNDATLRQRAAGVALTMSTLIQDVYSVVCGAAGTPAVRTVHAREFGTMFLTKTVDRAAGGAVRGLRITGSDTGISGTTVPPARGLPCPGGDPEAGTVRAAAVVSTTKTLALNAESGSATRQLAMLRTGPEIPAGSAPETSG